ncbi:MAG: DUF362 domain-containing protein [candidate division WOR-3 bacterium]
MRLNLQRIIKFLKPNLFSIGIGSLIWLIIRTGTKPSRITYPCQKVAANNSLFFLGGVALPYLFRRIKPIQLKIKWHYVLIPLFIIFLIIFINYPRVRKKGPAINFNFATLHLTERISSDSNPSSIFIVKDFPNPSGIYHTGLDSLFSLMAQHNFYFYKSNKPLPWCDTSGLIAKDDVVLIKVNAEWPERGMTNTDILKGLIARIVAHPDTFVGEVCLVENGQWRFSWSYSQNNAEDPSQSMQVVMDYFANQGYRVSGYNWTAIGYGSNNRWVSEFDQGDTNHGYVREDSSGMTYAKFRTIYGTRISTRLGIWNDTTYDNIHLKFINVPVLKSHTLMGVTGSIKHYIGFLSYAAIGNSTMHNRVVNNGLLGVEMGKARFPDLNIIDATWVSAEITTGPNAPNNLCTRLNTILASKDPVALDYIAGGRILRPVSWWQGHPWLSNYGRHDPDNLNSENPGSGRNYSDSTPCYGFPYNAFHQYLVATYNQLRARGYSVTMDTNQMNIYIFQFPGVEVKEKKKSKNYDQFEIEPNPFATKTVIRFSLPKKSQFSLKIYDSSGRLVKSFSANHQSLVTNHCFIWDGTDSFGNQLPSGTYLIRLESEKGCIEKKVILKRD